MRTVMCDAIVYVLRLCNQDVSAAAWHLDLHQVELEAYLKKLRIDENYKMAGVIEFKLGTSLASLETSAVAQTWIWSKYGLAKTGQRLCIDSEIVRWEMTKAYSYSPRKPQSHKRPPKLWRYWF